MPAFPNIDKTSVSELFAWLANPNGTAQPGRGLAASAANGGPVVASGGAPGGLELPAARPAELGRFGGPPYPEGSQVPDHRYYSSYGLDYPWIIKPPWSSVVAYDLNTGTIKWKVPLGEDEQAVAEGGRHTGLLRGGERRGMVVTSTGLIFVNGKDGKVRAFDEDNGSVLWTGTLPTGSEGIPAMYEVNGRQYLVVSSSTPLSFGRQAAGASAADAGNGANSGFSKGYVAFALPK